MKVIKLNATASTNSYLKEWALKNATATEVAVWAKHQTAGRGQQGTSWDSSAGEGLACSVLKRFSDTDMAMLPKLQIGVALAVKEALEAVGVKRLELKWPNDILSDAKKLGGILIENRWQASRELTSIVGIGVNVNQNAFINLPKATSMYLESGRTYEIAEVFQAVSVSVMTILQTLEKRSFDELRKAYEATLFRLGERGTFESPTGAVFQGVILGISETGALQVAKDTGAVETFQHKEIALRY
ncbi:biotin--[acetyl-CoA-carboxylase] ligase [Altibacter sp. HG106]|uniref:biotin--[acetyl-CoA-carboxylase] ligase n=1 Tax=Altibacter sp. HG106 TaxID=3023937 RepID=UPI002350C662|nr:biotin--[acetyl-CoA-carboxylase] ligase [Altibacter sp. HG106]MDC7995838.1 biotin--[acetyl-CoA-carboxylase] ligase [Altibacter sp. HG106]